MCNREIYHLCHFILSFIGNPCIRSNIHEEDYFVTNFGIKNGNRFITVGGATGGLMILLDDDGYQAYDFDNDKGISEISVAEGS